jgi:hypothetical protein
MGWFCCILWPPARIRELKAVHARKIKSLLTSISNLQDQNAALQRETKSHNVAQAVQKIQKRLREQELVSDVLKTMLTEASGQSRQEVQFEFSPSSPRQRDTWLLVSD